MILGNRYHRPEIFWRFHTYCRMKVTACRSPLGGGHRKRREIGAFCVSSLRIIIDHYRRPRSGSISMRDVQGQCPPPLQSHATDSEINTSKANTMTPPAYRMMRAATLGSGLLLTARYSSRRDATIIAVPEPDLRLVELPPIRQTAAIDHKGRPLQRDRSSRASLGLLHLEALLPLEVRAAACGSR